MNILIWIDSWDGWAYDIGGKTLASAIIDAAFYSNSVIRIGILLSSKWAVGASGKQSLFSVKTPDHQPGRYPAINIIWEQSEDLSTIQRGFRAFAFEKALVITKQHLFLWPFMIDEIFEGLENKEYKLSELTWKDIILNKIDFSKECIYPHDVNTLQYVYSEIAAGAAWEEVLEEIKNGKQEQIPI